MTAIKKKKITEVRHFVKVAVKQSRYKHSVRVMHTAERLCRKYGQDITRGRLAGIAHDLCKEFDADRLLLLAAKDGDAITPIEHNKPTLLHGRAAAVELRETFDIDDEEVLEAVKYHTFGKAGMGTLAQIIYIADKIEPGREHATPEYLAALEPLGLQELLFTVLSENIVVLEQKGKSVAASSLELYDELKKALNEG